MAGKTCHTCKRTDGTHTDGCVRKHCKRCAARAPEKCPYHGGTPKKPKTPTGGGTRRARRAQPEPAVARHGAAPDRVTVNGARDLLLAKLDEQLADARAEVRALERLRASVGA